MVYVFRLKILSEEIVVIYLPTFLHVGTVYYVKIKRF